MTHRRMLDFTEEEAAEIAKLAAASGESISALLRGWIEDFLESGSDVKPKSGVKRLQVVIDPSVVGRAEAQALTRYGVGLRDVLRRRLQREVSR